MTISPQFQQYLVLAIIAIVFALIAYRLVRKILFPAKNCSASDCCGCKKANSCREISNKVDTPDKL